MTSSAEPPCAPTPGTRRKLSGQNDLISASLSAFVAPTTNIMLSGVDMDIISSITALYKGFPSFSAIWNCDADALEVRASTIAHLSLYSRNGVMLSAPMYGASVTASKSIFAKKAFAYIFAVLPMSPLLASAIMNMPGHVVLI